MDYFFINGRKVEAHECLIDNSKYFHFVNLGLLSDRGQNGHEELDFVRF
jgi:hypothetical protein